MQQMNANPNPIPAAGGDGALGMLSGPFKSGIPSFTGGDAGPSRADLDSTTDITFSSAFSVAGQGGRANATATPTSNRGGFNDPLLILAALAVVVFAVRKK